MLQDKTGVEEESETLLSALTEMLDHVEDGPSTLSPFDMLPDTKLLTYQQCMEESAVGAHQLHPASVSILSLFTIAAAFSIKTGRCDVKY